jgi:hypothetical protein
VVPPTVNAPVAITLILRDVAFVLMKRKCSAVLAGGGLALLRLVLPALAMAAGPPMPIIVTASIATMLTASFGMLPPSV